MRRQYEERPLLDLRKRIATIRSWDPESLRTMRSVIDSIAEKIDVAPEQLASLYDTPLFRQDIECQGNVVLKLTEGDGCHCVEAATAGAVRKGQPACVSSKGIVCTSTGANQMDGIGIFAGGTIATSNMVPVAVSGLLREIQVDTAAVARGDSLVTSATPGRLTPRVTGSPGQVFAIASTSKGDGAVGTVNGWVVLSGDSPAVAPLGSTLMETHIPLVSLASPQAI